LAGFSSTYPGKKELSLAFPGEILYNWSIIPKYKEITMELENQIPEEEVSILTLTDENGQDTDFEYLDSIEYKGKEYLVLMPADEDATEIVILEIEPVDEENENYLSVSDERILTAVYEIFKEKYKDVLTFEAE